MPSRTSQIPVQCGTYYTVYPGDVPSQKYYYPETYNDNLIWSSGHYGWPNPPGAGNVGGAFKLEYNRTKNGSMSVGTIQGGTVYAEHRYKGSLHTDVGFSFPAPPWSDPNLFGSTAYARMKPDKPSMSGLNAIYELKDVPGMLRQRFHAKNLHEIGDYYLALQFGWKPLLSDIRNFVLTHRKAQDRLKQLIRDEGRPITRNITLSDTFAQNSRSNGGGMYLYPPFVGYFYQNSGLWTYTDGTYRRQWASARFRYWLPEGPRDVNWTDDMLSKIFGFKATPSVVYHALPWTWLADWFINVGDMINNLETSLVDRLAADYFYVMDNIENRSELTASTVVFREQTLQPISVSCTGTAARGFKTRLPGDPFGWGTSENSLSGVQLSILGALGLSRLR